MARNIVQRSRVEVSGPVEPTPTALPPPKEEGIPWGAVFVGAGIVAGLAILLSPNMKIHTFKPKTVEPPEKAPPMPPPTPT